MIARRYVRVLLAVLLVLVPALVGVLAASSVESEAASLPGSQAARGSGLTLLLEPGDSLLSLGALSALQLGAPPHTITASAGTGGSISPSGDVAVADGDAQSFAISPDSAYHIDDVLVDGNSVGAVTSYTFTNVTAPHSISASFALDTYTITASAGANGSISPSGAVSVNHGASQTFTITAAANHQVTNVLVDGNSVGAVTSYTFTNVTAPHSISASFALDTYTITASAGANGSISPSGAVSVNHGASQTFTITAAANHQVTNVLVDGNSVGAVTSYTFTNVTAPHSISASFALDTYTITASAGANGSISPSGAVSVNHGASQTFTITAAANHQVTNVLVDGNSVGAVTSYTFTNVTAPHSISASFALDTYTITASAGANGSISPSGAVSVNHGASQTFTITAAANHQVTNVLVDGNSVGAVTSYTFTNVTAPHSISASFALDTYTITASAGANGSISPSGAVSVNHGASQTFTITAAANHQVTNVLVDGNSVGAVTSYTFTNVTAPHSISASFALDTYTITASAGANGSISPSGAVSVNHGASQTFTITAAANHQVTNVLVDGNSVGAVTSYTFTNVTAPHSISATFAINTFTLSYTAGANGTISGEATQTVDYMASGTPVTAAPNTGYSFVSWSDGGLAATRIDANVTANLSVTATFAINTYTITPSAGANGGISPNAAQTVNHGAEQAFTITPATGYHVADVLVDGSSIGAVTSYTFTNVTAPHSISASFAINTYTITPSAGPNGAISPNAPQSLDHGSAQTFTVTPATGYYVADVLVDGVSVGPVTSYTFTAVSANHTISASFAPGIQTRLSISVGETTVDYGSSTLLSGVLYDSGDPLHEMGMGDRLVIVQSASSATGPWVDLETPTTSSVAGSEGTFTSTVTPTGPSYYRLRFIAGAGSGYGGSISFVVRVSVRPILGTPKGPSSVRAGRSFSVSGTLSPRFPAGQKTVAVKVYRYKNRHWVSSSQVWAVNADSGDSSRYSVKMKLTKKGKYRFRAYTAPTPAWAGDTTGLSRVLTVR